MPRAVCSWFTMVSGAVVLASACRRQPGSPQYEVVSVERRDLVAASTGDATIHPLDSVTIRSKAAGQVVSVNVATGDEVHARQLLIQIDPELPQEDVRRTAADLSAARVTLATAQIQLDRAEQLYRAETISRQELDSITLIRDTSRSAVVRAQGDWENARIELGDVSIEAPTKGIVLDVGVNGGSVVSSTTLSMDTTPLLTIGDIDSVDVVALVGETFVAPVHAGMDALVTVDAYPEQVFHGRVTRVEPQSVIQNVETFFPVHVIVSNPWHVLKPGMNAEISVPTGERRDVLTVPYAALRTPNDVRAVTNLLGLAISDAPPNLRGPGPDSIGRPSSSRRFGRPVSDSAGATSDGEFLVFTRRNSTIRVIPVRTGITDADWTEVEDGLQDDDTVLILPSASLLKDQRDMQQRSQRFGRLPGVR